MKQFITLIFLLFSLQANAYVGPGMGIGVLGILIGLIAAIILSIVGLFWYPLKRRLKKHKLIKPSPKSAKEKKKVDQSNKET